MFKIIEGYREGCEWLGVGEKGKVFWGDDILIEFRG